MAPSLISQSLLRTTLPHPKAERSYAQYEITQLLPGIELFSDKVRADICIVIASLYYVIRELHYAKYNLIVSDVCVCKGDSSFLKYYYHELHMCNDGILFFIIKILKCLRIIFF